MSEDLLYMGIVGTAISNAIGFRLIEARIYCGDIFLALRGEIIHHGRRTVAAINYFVDIEAARL